MLHIATVHFRSFRWIPIQLRQLERTIGVSYVTWVSLEEIDPAWGGGFDHVFQQRGRHAAKLNELAERILCVAEDDDLLMFIDGDAFPIADPWPLIEYGLSTGRLLAVCREENGKDSQPHPCFCVTTVATWRDLPGDWRAGAVKENGGRRDVGGWLLQRLTATDTPWTKVRRSNRHDLHPVFFGVYGDTIYHHGAGFRKPVSEADITQCGSLDRAEMVRVGLRNLQRSQNLFSRIERDDPTWLSELA